MLVVAQYTHAYISFKAAMIQVAAFFVVSKAHLDDV